MPDALMTLAEWKSRNSACQYSPITDTLEKVYKAKTIYDRFDAFAALIDECDRLLKLQPDHVDAQTLKAQALIFAMSIVAAKDKANLSEKIAARRQYAKIDPYYMPWNTPATKTNVTKSKTDEDQHAKPKKLDPRS